MFNLYIPGINTSISPKVHEDNIFSGKIVYELCTWIENNPNVIHSTNVSDSLFFKVNGTILNNHNYLLQISVQELQNYMILPIPPGFWYTKFSWKIMHRRYVT